MKNIVTGLMIAIAGAVAVIGGGVPLATFAATPLAATGVWGTLSVLSNILAPVVGGLVAVIVWLHKRIDALENSNNDLESSVFGNEQDALNEGVLLEVRNINNRLDEIQNSIERLRDEQERLREVQNEHVLDND